jgi:hypothetical protein
MGVIFMSGKQVFQFTFLFYATLVGTLYANERSDDSNEQLQAFFTADPFISALEAGGDDLILPQGEPVQRHGGLEQIFETNLDGTGFKIVFWQSSLNEAGRVEIWEVDGKLAGAVNFNRFGQGQWIWNTLYSRGNQIVTLWPKVLNAAEEFEAGFASRGFAPEGTDLRLPEPERQWLGFGGRAFLSISPKAQDGSLPAGLLVATNNPSLGIQSNGSSVSISGLRGSPASLSGYDPFLSVAVPAGNGLPASAFAVSMAGAGGLGNLATTPVDIAAEVKREFEMGSPWSARVKESAEGTAELSFEKPQGLPTVDSSFTLDVQTDDAIYYYKYSGAIIVHGNVLVFRGKPAGVSYYEYYHPSYITLQLPKVGLMRDGRVQVLENQFNAKLKDMPYDETIRNPDDYPGAESEVEAAERVANAVRESAGYTAKIIPLFSSDGEPAGTALQIDKAPGTIYVED